MNAKILDDKDSVGQNVILRGNSPSNVGGEIIDFRRRNDTIRFDDDVEDDDFDVDIEVLYRIQKLAFSPFLKFFKCATLSISLVIISTNKVK